MRPLIDWLAHWATRIGLAIAAGVLALVVLFSFVNPPTTLTILSEGRRLGSVDRQWTPLEEIAPDAFAARIKRPGVVNCWDDSAFAAACRNTGRRHFIMAGITTDVCLAPPAISAAEEGFAVTAVVDASGSLTALTDEMVFRKMERGGVELTTTSALLAELAVNWASEAGQKIMQILGEEILSRG